MFKQSLALVAAVALVSLTLGCRDNGGNLQPLDLAVSTGSDQGAGSGDMAKPTGIAATPHGIDTNAVGGMFGKGVAVSIPGLIATTPVHYYKCSSKTKCCYEAFAQDPACTTPPCGILLEVKDIALNTAGKCDYPDTIMPPIALTPVKEGDKIDITGTVDLFSGSGMVDGGAAGSWVQHSVVLTSLTDNGAGTLPMPMTVTDGAMFTAFTGAGWATYEGTRVKVQPSTMLTITENLQATSVAPYTFRTNPGQTEWGTNYDLVYQSKTGTQLDAVGTMYTSITGVVGTVFGGAVLPTQAADFMK
jgi:hypothetical protein